jgi:hypothetical protein
MAQIFHIAIQLYNRRNRFCPEQTSSQSLLFFKREYMYIPMIARLSYTRPFYLFFMLVVLYHCYSKNQRKYMYICLTDLKRGFNSNQKMLSYESTKTYSYIAMNPVQSLHFNVRVIIGYFLSVHEKGQISKVNTSLCTISIN